MISKPDPAAETIYISPKDLIPYINNARVHSQKQIDQVAASIEEWGFTNPILLTEDKQIIAGHCRLLAAKKLKLKKVPVMFAKGWTPEQIKAYVIADNNLALNSSWDNDLLKSELLDLNETFDLSLIGFDDSFLDAFLQETILGNDLNLEDEEIDFEPKIIKVKPGDVWVLGNHKLVCGDATNSEDIAKICEPESVNLWLTDPPYNVNYEGKTKDKLKIENDQMNNNDFCDFLIQSYSAANIFMKSGSAFYIWHADSEGYNFRKAVFETGWKLRQCLIWVKNTIVMGRQDYHWKHEPCLYGWKDGAPHNWFADRKQSTVLNFDKPQRNAEHPTMKPVELFEYLIQNSTDNGQLVLDSFGGSGTTIMACERLGRLGRVVEYDPKYCDIIIQRWQKATNKDAILEGTDKTYAEI